MSLEDADKEQSQLFNELKDMGTGKTSVEKKSFLKNARLFLSARETILNNFETKIFPTKNSDKIPAPEPSPEPAVFDTPKPTKT